MSAERIPAIMLEAQEMLRKGSISRRDFLRLAALLGVSLTSAYALAACAPAVAPTSAPVPTTAPAAATAVPRPTTAPPTVVPTLAGPTGDITVLIQGEPTTLDWLVHADLNAHEIDRNIFDTPLRRDHATLEIKGHLAESFRMVNDTTWEFKLRKGVNFHNGEPFNAQAMKFSIERIVNPATNAPGRANVKLIDHVDVIDDYTANVVTSAPMPNLPERMTSGVQGTLAMLPPKYFNDKGAAFFARNPIGTGPFKFVEWVANDHVKLAANTDYFLGAPGVKSITFKPVSEPATRVAALIAGQADLVSGLTAEDVDKVNNSGVATVKTATRGNWVINILVTNYLMDGPWTDKRVRQAMNYAVDMPTIVKTILGGRAKVVGYSLEPEAFGFDPDIKWYPYDPVKAKQLLVDAGVPNGFPMTLHVPNHRYPNDVEIAQAVGAYWGKIGITTDVKVWEQSTYVTRWNARQNLPAYIVAFGGAGTLDGFLLQNAYYSGNTLCIYKNTDLDALLDKAASTMDPAARKDLYWKAQQMIYDEAPTIQSWQPESLFGVSKKLTWDPWLGTMLVFMQEDYKATFAGG